MKYKDFVLSIGINALLAHLWILFMNNINSYSMKNPLLGLISVFLGSILFWEILNRITPFNEYKNSHPVKIAGFVSIGVVFAVNLSMTFI